MRYRSLRAPCALIAFLFARLEDCCFKNCLREAERDAVADHVNAPA